MYCLLPRLLVTCVLTSAPVHATECGRACASGACWWCLTVACCLAAQFTLCLLLTHRPVLLLMQRDVTEHVLQEQQLLQLTEGNLAMLSQVIEAKLSFGGGGGVGSTFPVL